MSSDIKRVTEEDVTKAIENMASELRTTPDPEAIAKLREEYGVTFDITGKLVQIKEPKKLRKAVKEQLEEQSQESKVKGQSMAQSLTRGASKTGEVIAYALVDAPIEGAKTAKQVIKTTVRNRAQRSKEAHHRRLAKADERKARRLENKARRAEARAEAEKREAEQAEAQATKTRKQARAEAREAARQEQVKTSPLPLPKQQ